MRQTIEASSRSKMNSSKCERVVAPAAWWKWNLNFVRQSNDFLVVQHIFWVEHIFEVFIILHPAEIQLGKKNCVVKQKKLNGKTLIVSIAGRGFEKLMAPGKQKKRSKINRFLFQLQFKNKNLLHLNQFRPLSLSYYG